MDSFVELSLMEGEQQQERERLAERKKKHKEYFQAKDAYLPKMRVGLKVDFRDSAGVWKVGTVKGSFFDESTQTKFIKIHCSKSKRICAVEDVRGRIAAKGFYTDRTDIPYVVQGKLIIKHG